MKNIIIELIGHDRLGEALDHLMEILPARLGNNVILLKARLASLK